MKKHREVRKQPEVIGLPKKTKKKKFSTRVNEVEDKIIAFFKTLKGRKILTTLGCLVVAVIGAFFIIGGVMRVNEMRDKITDRSIEDLNSESILTTKEMDKKIKERDDEFEKNGVSDKYLELANEVYSMSSKVSKNTNSVYLKDNGVEMPNTLFQKIRVAPALLYGFFIIILAVVLWVASMKRLDYKKDAKKAAKKEAL